MATLHAETVDLVDIHAIDPSIQVDLRYATTNNFMGEVLYQDNRCFARPLVAERLMRAQRRLQKKGYGLKVYDCYRPLSVQKRMFERFPQPGYVADPKKGSHHNRGAAVDVGLVDGQGKEMPMPSAYDEFSERSHAKYRGAKFREFLNRQTLRDAMVAVGFKPISTEWWHFNDPNAKQYEILDIAIEKINTNATGNS